MEKGYKLCLQMVSVTSYNDEDVIEFSNHVNSINPFAVGIVDTYGLMHKEQVFHYFEMLDNHLNRSIAIGYHSHNNFQLAYSNSIEVLKIPSERTVILDGTLYGMGKSAGNAPIELLSMHLNEFYGKNYDINQLLEAIDVGIMPIFEQHRWGYSLQFYIAAKNDCHPNYVKYLLDKKTLAVKDVDNILGMINEESKLKYDAEYIVGPMPELPDWLDPNNLPPGFDITDPSTWVEPEQPEVPDPETDTGSPDDPGIDWDDIFDSGND